MFFSTYFTPTWYFSRTFTCSHHDSARHMCAKNSSHTHTHRRARVSLQRACFSFRSGEREVSVNQRSWGRMGGSIKGPLKRGHRGWKHHIKVLYGDWRLGTTLQVGIVRLQKCVCVHVCLWVIVGVWMAGQLLGFCPGGAAFLNCNVLYGPFQYKSSSTIYSVVTEVYYPLARE